MRIATFATLAYRSKNALTKAPTAAPTSSAPTNAGTTGQPTAVPSVSPTARPTTSSPTNAGQTRGPTSSPTAAPSAAPTRGPSPTTNAEPYYAMLFSASITQLGAGDQSTLANVSGKTDRPVPRLVGSGPDSLDEYVSSKSTIAVTPHTDRPVTFMSWSTANAASFSSPVRLVKGKKIVSCTACDAGTRACLADDTDSTCKWRTRVLTYGGSVNTIHGSSNRIEYSYTLYAHAFVFD